MLDRPRLSIAMTWMASAAMLAPLAKAQQAVPAQDVPVQAPSPMDRAPILTGPGLITVAAGGTLTTWYTVSDDRTPPAALELTVSVPDRALLPEGSVQLEGEGSRRALTIAPPPGHAGSASLSMTLVDGAGLSVRGSVVVTVVEAVESRPIPIPPAPPIIPPTGTRAGTTTSAMAWPSAPFAAVSSCGGHGAMASGPSTGWSSPASGSWSGASGPVVTRYELVRGRTAVDGPALFDAAYQHYWAGSYAQAEEAAAASAYLWDDPRAWEYLAMSAAARGDEATAAPAARYAAAKVLSEPTFENDLARSLTRLQGPERRRIEALQTGIVDRTAALEVLAARPDVLHGMVPSPAPAPAR